MKRPQRQRANTSRERPITIATSRLAGARGGDDVGITVEVPPPPDPYISQQHNEALVRL